MPEREMAGEGSSPPAPLLDRWTAVVTLIAWTPALVAVLGFVTWRAIVPHCQPAVPPCHGPFGLDLGPLFRVGTVAYWLIPVTGPVMLVTGLVLLAVPFRWAWRTLSRARGRPER